MTREGKIILEAAGRVAMAPDGNGGIYPALQRTGALADMRGRGVEHVHVFSIDNALVRVADPHFLGYCVEKKADCGNKSVWKAEPGEKVRCATRPSVVREKGWPPSFSGTYCSTPSYGGGTLISRACFFANSAVHNTPSYGRGALTLRACFVANIYGTFMKLAPEATAVARRL